MVSCTLYRSRLSGATIAGRLISAHRPGSTVVGLESFPTAVGDTCKLARSVGAGAGGGAGADAATGLLAGSLRTDDATSGSGRSAATCDSTSRLLLCLASS